MNSEDEEWGVEEVTTWFALAIPEYDLKIKTLSSPSTSTGAANVNNLLYTNWDYKTMEEEEYTFLGSFGLTQQQKYANHPLPSGVEEIVHLHVARTATPECLYSESSDTKEYFFNYLNRWQEFSPYPNCAELNLELLSPTASEFSHLGEFFKELTRRTVGKFDKESLIKIFTPLTETETGTVTLLVYALTFSTLNLTLENPGEPQDESVVLEALVEVVEGKITDRTRNVRVGESLNKTKTGSGLVITPPPTMVKQVTVGKVARKTSQGFIDDAMSTRLNVLYEKVLLAALFNLSTPFDTLKKYALLEDKHIPSRYEKWETLKHQSLNTLKTLTKMQPGTVKVGFSTLTEGERLNLSTALKVFCLKK